MAQVASDPDCAQALTSLVVKDYGSGTPGIPVKIPLVDGVISNSGS